MEFTDRSGLDEIFETFPYGTTVPAECPETVGLTIVLAVDRAQLTRFFEPTPFEVVAPYVFLSATDFSNNSHAPFLDVSLVVPARYQDHLGGFVIREFEDTNRTVLGGREKWGYPKTFANIDVTGDEHTAKVHVHHRGQSLIDMDWNASPVPQHAPEAVTTPHLLLRALPACDREGIAFAEILERDSSDHLDVTSRVSGTGSVTFGGQVRGEWDLGLELLANHEVVAAERVVGDWATTNDNGWARVIERLI